MVMVEIDSNAILVEPINSRNDHEFARAYRVLMTHLQQARIVPKKHILDNKVSEAMKTIIKDKYKMAMELVPPGCHRRNAAEVAIRNFKAHLLSVLTGAAEDFPPSLLHKKTDKRGIWAYHSVNGWYLSTPPEHYRTHRCHINQK